MTTALLTPVDDDATRRQFLTALGAAGLLTACAAPTMTDPTTSPTRRLTDDLGTEMDLPVRPQRVITLSGYFAAAVLEAGGPLVGTVFGEQILDDDLRATFGLDGVTDIGEPGVVNVEAIAALAPDLIIAELRRGAVEGLDDLDLLRAVAPVYGIELFQPVEAISSRIADAVAGDAAERSAAARTEFETAVTELRELLAVPDLSTSFIVYSSPDAYTYGPEQVPPVDVLTRAGVTWLPIVEEAQTDGGDLMLSLERLGELSADLIVVYNGRDSDLASVDVFAALPAARAGQVVELPRRHYAITWRNYAAWARQLTQQVRALGPLDASLVP